MPAAVYRHAMDDHHEHDHDRPASPFAELDAIRAATVVLADATRRRPDSAVPACPGWDVTQLAAHLGFVQRWSTVVLRTRATERPGPTPWSPHRTDRPWRTGCSPGSSPSWPPCRTPGHDAPVWNFAGRPPTSAFWWRRQSCEAWVHAVDATDALGEPSPMPADAGVAVVDEFLELLPGRKLARLPDASIGGSLHLHATDDAVVGEWMLELEGGRLTVAHGHGKGAAAVRAPAAELAMWIWGRRDATAHEAFQVFGDAAVVRAWQAIGAF